ncbi:hypothetical protein QBC35DRAFT_106444 [Podospora australis]|uniref:DUF7492 domain-containing protein n=1 Tax=Podospora australis TaxID=1536484 RepID=A0AAN6X3L2_9PEZI|nr:hypothetical protein QBC35DRAFT_106444 [Podospora australis]
MRISPSISSRLAATVLALSGTAVAHSWPEETYRIAPNGTILADANHTGYDRAHIPRGDPRQQDFLIPPNGREKVILPTDKIVRESQYKLDGSSYSEKFPKLKVAPGDFVAIRYLENGHVTAPDKANPFKPLNRGTIYLYGTKENDLTNVNLVDVLHTWTADGKGGNGKGKLLATRNYDDGQCHEPAPASGDPEGIGAFRKQFISKAESLACQTDLQLPTDLKPGDVYTVLWIWDWPDMSEPGVPVPPATFFSNNTSKGPFVKMPEIYTGVLDYDVVDPCDDALGPVKGPTCKQKKGFIAPVRFAANQDPANRGILRQMLNPFLVEVPQAGFDVPESGRADPANIPLGALIGLKNPTIPLPSSVLDAQTRYFEPPSAVPQPTGGAGGGSGGGNGDGDNNSSQPSSTAPAEQPSKTRAPRPTRIPKPSTTPTAKPSATAAPDAGNGDGEDNGVFTVTVTIPETFSTVYVKLAEPTPSS